MLRCFCSKYLWPYCVQEGHLAIVAIKKNEAYLHYFSLSFLFYSSNFRPSLTRAETIESCNSDDLVTVLEMHNRKPYKIIDRKREVKKGVMAETLDELVNRGKILPQL